MDNQSRVDNLVGLKDLKWLWETIYRWWPIYLITICLFTLIGYLYNHKQKQIFSSKIEILLNSSETYNYQEGLNSKLGYYNYFADLANQKRIIKSYDLVNKVVENLNLGVSYYIQGRINKKEFFQNLPFKINYNFASQNIKEKELNFKILNSDKYQISFTLNDVDYSFVHFFDSLQTNIFYSIKTNLISGNDNFISDEIKDIDYKIIFHDKSYWINKIISSLNVENVEFTSVLKVTSFDQIPRRSRLILDTLAKEYITNTLKNELRINENTLHNINKQLYEVVSILDSIQYSIEKLKNSKNIININKESDLYFSELVKNNLNSKNIILKIKTLKNLMNYLIDFSDDKIVPPSLYILKDDSYLNLAIDDYYKDKIKLIDKRFGFKSEHLSQEKLKVEIDNKRRDLIIYIKNLIEALENENTEVLKEIDRFKKLARKNPFSKNDISSIERKLKVNERIYTYLLEKRANTIIARSGILPKTKIIEKARTVGMVSGKSPKYILLFSLIGFLLSYISVIIYRVFFETISDVATLFEKTNMPIIGGISFLENEEDFTKISLESKGQFVESLRTIRTASNFLLSKTNSKNLKTFLVSSIHPGEGKTFTTINLARIYSATGKKVLIVDFDLHKPKIHKVLKLSNDIGNSTNLSSSLKFENSLTKIDENLFVIPSGPVPPNPSELVLSSRVNELIKFCESKFDYLFFDTPPIGIISDALVLSSSVDHTIFVMNTKFANKKGLDYLQNISEQSNIKSNGIILNGIKNRKWKYYYGNYKYGYSYGYKYSYGYSNRDEI